MEKNYPEFDHRLFPRYIIECPALITITNTSEQAVVVVVKDICPRGAGIFCNRPLDIYEEVELEMNGFFDKRIQKKARVVWCREVSKGFWRAGLDFRLDNLLELDKAFQ